MILILKNSNVKFASYLGKFKLKIFLVLFLTLLDTIIVIASPKIISNIATMVFQQQQKSNNAKWIIPIITFIIFYNISL